MKKEPGINLGSKHYIRIPAVVQGDSPRSGYLRISDCVFFAPAHP